MFYVSGSLTQPNFKNPFLVCTYALRRSCIPNLIEFRLVVLKKNTVKLIEHIFYGSGSQHDCILETLFLVWVHELSESCVPSDIAIRFLRFRDQWVGFECEVFYGASWLPSYLAVVMSHSCAGSRPRSLSRLSFRLWAVRKNFMFNRCTCNEGSKVNQRQYHALSQSVTLLMFPTI